MLFVLSPAKSLNEDPAPAELPHTRTLFTEQSAELIGVLKEKSPQQIAGLMDLSDKLSALNVARYQAWKLRASTRNAKQSVLAFDGDVYDGLRAKDLDASTLQWLQEHLCILSGLYGVLRPLDLMQPYRLEMGTALATGRGSNLYQFWGTELAQYLNMRLRGDKQPVVVNLASQEYFKAVDTRVLKARVIDCVFEDFKGGTFKIISFFAKRARGLMMRYAALNQCSTPEQLKGFDLDGYAFAPEVSTDDRLVFRRKTV
jgi:cytoplasmic iron level regulating protein YaaA (DUF328/UPF0246 family)